MSETTNEVLFGITKGDPAYPTADTVIFGAEYANKDFVVPMAKFTFYSAKGESLSGSAAPTIYVRMGGTFNTTLINGYQEVAGIMGTPGGPSIFEGELGQTLGRFGDSFITAIQKQIVAGVAGAGGYFASAGQSGKSQVEFLQRKMLNNFQQLIYQGPTFRRFQLPFNMRPSDRSEAERMLEIIASFRIASSPSSGFSTSISQLLDEELSRSTNVTEKLTEQPVFQGEGFESETEEEYFQRVNAWAGKQSFFVDDAEEALLDEAVNKSSSVFTFGYPDMCKLELVLYKPDNTIITLFKSDYCMIESVSVDYGAQNKMTFFDGGSNATQYFPTDVNLTISLRESTLITSPKATNEYLSGTVIL
jgi:hypothetical protein